MLLFVVKASLIDCQLKSTSIKLNLMTYFSITIDITYILTLNTVQVEGGGGSINIKK